MLRRNSFDPFFYGYWANQSPDVVLVVHFSNTSMSIQFSDKLFIFEKKK